MPSFTATYTVHVGWDPFGSTDVFTLNSSTFNSTKKLYNPLKSSYAGSDDSILPYVLGFVVDRGKELGQAGVQAGTATIHLVDTTGRFNAKNAASPLFGKLLPMRPVRIQATYNAITYQLFNGFTDTIDYDLETKSATINCYDAMQILDTQSAPVISELGGLYTLEVMNFILRYSGIPEDQLIAVPGATLWGDFISVWPGMDGTKTSLSALQDLISAERGDFFVGRDGVFKYSPRVNRTDGHAATAMPTGVSVKFKAGVSRELIRNRATVQVTDQSEPQEFRDEKSIATYGLLDEPTITNSLLNDDEQALSLAGWLVNRRKSAITSSQEAIIEANVSATILPAALTRELVDLISVTESGNTGTYWVESIKHEVSEGGLHHITTLGLSERRPNESPFIIGTSTIGGTDGLVWSQET